MLPCNLSWEYLRSSEELPDHFASHPTKIQISIDQTFSPIHGRVPKVLGTLLFGSASTSCRARATSRGAPWSPDIQPWSHSVVLSRNCSSQSWVWSLGCGLLQFLKRIVLSLLYHLCSSNTLRYDLNKIRDEVNCQDVSQSAQGRDKSHQTCQTLRSVLKCMSFVQGPVEVSCSGQEKCYEPDNGVLSLDLSFSLNTG